METEEKREKELFSGMAVLCSKGEWCSPDVRKKILAAGGSRELAERIIERLVTEKFVDDDRYVRSYIRDKFRINRWGKVKIRYYLKMKGLEEELIESGFSEIAEEEYRRILLRTMKEKASQVKGKNRYDKMGQIIRYAQGRGFEPEWIHRLLDEVEV